MMVSEKKHSIRGSPQFCGLLQSVQRCNLSKKYFFGCLELLQCKKDVVTYV